MNKKLILIIGLFLIMTPSITFISYKYFSGKTSQKEAINNENNSNSDEIETTPEFYETVIEEEIYPYENTQDIEEMQIELSAYIPYWDKQNILISLNDSNNQFESISPSWYFVEADGSIKTKGAMPDKEILQILRDKNIKIIPSISNPDAESLSNILNNPNLLNSHIQNILNLIIYNNFYGVDIDYENIKGSDRDQFSNFIKLLSERIHENNKILTIAILWKDNLSVFEEALSESRKAQDWENIGKHVDEFRIMAYNYTGASDKPGPIAPYSWIDSILTYAKTQIDQEKIVLGLPLYAYDWVENTAGAKALVFNNVNNIISSNQIISNSINNQYYEKELIYVINNVRRIVWYQDLECTKLIIQTGDNHGVNKFIFWRLGGEEEGTFNLENYKNE